MKVAVFLLVLGNLLFLAFSQGYFGQPDNPDAGRLAKQINVDSLRIVGRGDPPQAAPARQETATPAPNEALPASPATPAAASPATAVAAAPAVVPAAAPATPAAVAAAAPAAKPAEKPAVEQACTIWPNLANDDADKLGKLLTADFKDLNSKRKTAPGEGGSWWVYIPPLASKAEAERKATELKRMGITDYFVIQDNSANRWAISLGIFSVESGAKSRFAELKEKGVRSAKLGTRGGRESLSLEVRGPATRLQALRAAAGKAAQDCK